MFCRYEKKLKGVSALIRYKAQTKLLKFKWYTTFMKISNKKMLTNFFFLSVMVHFLITVDLTGGLIMFIF